MRSSPEAVPAHLRPYLRALWQPAFSLQALPPQAVQRGHLDGDALWLPAGLPPPLAEAAAAHAGAHRRHGGPRIERGALKPIQQILLGLLEDARVEALAMQELPGLRRLWTPLHRAGEHSGGTAEALLQRLARGLIDPHYRDPHGWVQKGRALCAALPLTGDPTALRRVASLLGHDLGQMRLPLLAREYLVQPAYRDDNAHLWTTPSDAAQAVVSPTSAAGAADAAAGRVQAETAERASAQPEWDHRIGQLRPDWCTLIERTAPSADPGPLQQWLSGQSATVQRLRRLLQAGGTASMPGRPQRSTEGERFHLGALVDTRIAQRLRQPADDRIHLRATGQAAPLAVRLLLDASASTADAAPDGGSVLDALRGAALLVAQALDEAGHACTLSAFHSDTRHAVRIEHLKQGAERLSDPAVLARAAGLRSQGSTRLGAVLRHAVAALRAERGAGRPLVLLLTDGAAHDIDVHDPRHLPADFAHAVRSARRAGVRVAWLDASRHRAALPQRLWAALQRSAIA
jgi:hypothetical protein